MSFWQPGVPRQTVCACRWDKYVVWGASIKVDRLSAPLSEVVVFAPSLPQKGLVLGTVKGVFVSPFSLLEVARLALPI